VAFALEAFALEAAAFDLPAALEPPAGLLPAGLLAAGGGGVDLFPLTIFGLKVSNRDFMVVKSAWVTPAPCMTERTMELNISKSEFEMPIL